MCTHVCKTAVTLAHTWGKWHPAFSTPYKGLLVVLCLIWSLANNTAFESQQLWIPHLRAVLFIWACVCEKTDSIAIIGVYFFFSQNQVQAPRKDPSNAGAATNKATVGSERQAQAVGSNLRRAQPRPAPALAASRGDYCTRVRWSRASLPARQAPASARGRKFVFTREGASGNIHRHRHGRARRQRQQNTPFVCRRESSLERGGELPRQKPARRGTRRLGERSPGQGCSGARLCPEPGAAPHLLPAVKLQLQQGLSPLRVAVQAPHGPGEVADDGAVRAASIACPELAQARAGAGGTTPPAGSSAPPGPAAPGACGRRSSPACGEGRGRGSRRHRKSWSRTRSRSWASPEHAAVTGGGGGGGGSGGSSLLGASSLSPASRDGGAEALQALFIVVWRPGKAAPCSPAALAAAPAPGSRSAPSCPEPRSPPAPARRRPHRPARKRFQMSLQQQHYEKLGAPSPEPQSSSWVKWQ